MEAGQGRRYLIQQRPNAVLVVVSGGRMGDQSVDRQGPHSGFRGKYFYFPDNSLEIKLEEEEEEEVIVTHLHALFM